MNPLAMVRRAKCGVQALAMLILLAWVYDALAAEVTITASDQMPPGLLFVGDKAMFKLDICVEPATFKNQEIEYVFASLKFIQEKIVPAVPGESVKVTLPKPVIKGNKVIFKGATVQTTAFQQPGKKEIILQAEAIYTAKGKPNQTAKSNVIRLALAVDDLQIVMIDEKGKETVIGTTKGPVKTVTTIVGKKISLKGKIVPVPADPKDVTEPLWTIPEVATIIVKSYVTNNKVGKKTLLDKRDLAKDAIAYYWIDGDRKSKVQFQTKYKKRLLKATAEFDVKRPTAVWLSDTTTITKDKKGVKDTKGVVVDDKYGLMPGTWLHFGQKSSPGISWTYEVKPPAGFGGESGIAQLVDERSVATLDTKPPTTEILSTDGKFVLDTGFPFVKSEQKVPAAMPMADNDSPGTKLAPYDPKNKFSKLIAVSETQRFQTFLMFRPDGKDSIWVTLQGIGWHWQGSAVKDKAGVWKLGNKPAPEATEYDGKKGTDSIALPEWDKNSKDLNFK